MSSWPEADKKVTGTGARRLYHKHRPPPKCTSYGDALVKDITVVSRNR